MSIKGRLAGGLVLPSSLVCQEMRRVSGGKNLDGSFWLEIEGQERVTLSPRQWHDMAVGMLEALGIGIEHVPQPGMALNG